MIIHVVQEGDTLESIAKQYNSSAIRLIQDNGLITPLELVPGQTIVIVYPLLTHTVQEGDTVFDIANQYEITLLQLIRNNPFLINRKYIYPGEELIIRYDNNHGILTTNGYANTFIDINTLKSTLPFLTYLSIFGYRTTITSENIDIVGIEDDRIIQLAKDFKVAPIMLLSTMTTQGGGNPDAVIKLLSSELLIYRHIEEIIRILRRKGYYGVNITYQFLTEDIRLLYENYTEKLAARLKQEGFIFFITFSQNFVIEGDQLTFDKVELTAIGKLVDGITILNYNWGYSYGPPEPVTSVFLMRRFYDYIITMIPPEKIEIGIPLIGYDWELPYQIGITKANALTIDSAVALANNVGARIHFDEVSQTPYFRYVEDKNGIHRVHIVWFVDARSIDAILDLRKEYGFRGIGAWNIMNYYQQLWLITNTQFEIDNLFL